jgi:hypothetical protein
MKQLFLFFFSIFLLSISFSFAQKRFSYGAELGVNYAGLPYVRKTFDTEKNETSIDKYSPVTSPTGGFWAKYYFGKHFFSNIAVQYTRIGETIYSHLDRDQITPSTHITETWYHLEMQRFQRVSMPISFGYQFRIQKRKFEVSLGYKQNYFINGSHTQESVYINNGKAGSYKYEENPFKRLGTAKRWTSGAFTGFGMNLTPRINLGLNYGINETVVYGYAYGNCATGAYTYYYSHDLFLMLKYAFR